VTVSATYGADGAAPATARSAAPASLLYLFLAVPITYLVALIGFPIVYNVVMSFQEVTMGNLADLDRPWTGFDNYRDAIADPVFTKVIVNSIVFVAANVAGQVGLGLFAAACFARRFAGANFLRGLLLSGWILPALVVGAIWKWMFATEYGVVNHALMALHLINSPIHWLSDPAMAMTALNIAHIWYAAPFCMILIAAALTAIPEELYEAAAIDGAGVIGRFRYVTLPALRPTLLAVSCLVAIFSLRAFDMIFVLTRGGPLDSTNVLPLLSYQFSFVQFEFGKGAAIGSFSFVLVLAVAIIYVIALRHEEEAA
jgi:multiple sugar transport system permease protein